LTKNESLYIKSSNISLQKLLLVKSGIMQTAKH